MTTIYTAKSLGAVATSSLTTIYTVPSNTVTRIEKITITNGATAGTVTIKWYDATVTTNYFLINAYPIPANGLLEIAAEILETNDYLQILTTTTTDLNIKLNYTEATTS
jgi:hypothetical protein